MRNNNLNRATIYLNCVKEHCKPKKTKKNFFKCSKDVECGTNIELLQSCIDDKLESMNKIDYVAPLSVLRDPPTNKPTVPNKKRRQNLNNTAIYAEIRDDEIEPDQTNHRNNRGASGSENNRRPPPPNYKNQNNPDYDVPFNNATPYDNTLKTGTHKDIETNYKINKLIYDDGKIKYSNKLDEHGHKIPLNTGTTNDNGPNHNNKELFYGVFDTSSKQTPKNEVYSHLIHSKEKTKGGSRKKKHTMKKKRKQSKKSKTRKSRK